MGFLAKSSLTSKRTKNTHQHIPEFFELSRRRILSIPRTEYVSAPSVVATLRRLVDPFVCPAFQSRGCGFVWNPPRPGIHTQGWSSFVSRRPSAGPSGKPSRANTFYQPRSGKVRSGMGKKLNQTISSDHPTTLTALTSFITP